MTHIKYIFQNNSKTAVLTAFHYAQIQWNPIYVTHKGMLVVTYVIIQFHFQDFLLKEKELVSNRDPRILHWNLSNIKQNIFCIYVCTYEAF